MRGDADDGGNSAITAWLPGLWVAGDLQAVRGLRLRLRLGLNEVAADSPLLRAYGARDGAVLALELAPSAREFLRAQASLWRLHDRGPFSEGEIALGGGAELALGHRLRLGEPAVELFATGAFMANRLDPTYQLPWRRGGAAPALGGAAFIGARFAQAGIGVAIQRGAAPESEILGPPGPPGPRARRLRYHLETWLGWLAGESGDPGSLGFEVRAGVAVGLGRGQELALAAYSSNNQRGAQGQLYLGGSVRYAY